MNRAIGIALLLVLAACAGAGQRFDLGAPPPIAATVTPSQPPAAKSISLESVCPPVEVWTNADMAAAVAPVADGTLTMKALLEWYRLRKDAQACAASARSK